MGDISTVVDGITYSIAISKKIKKSLTFVHSGAKGGEVAVVAQEFYSNFLSLIENGNHNESIILSRSSSGASLLFADNVLNASIKHYTLISSGGNGGKGGAASIQGRGTSVGQIDGGGGGGGESGERFSANANLSVSRVDCDYLRSGGSLSIKAWNGSSLVLNIHAMYGQDGGDVLEFNNGLGGKDYTSGSDGSAGTHGEYQAPGTAGRGAALSGTSYGRGGNGGAGSPTLNQAYAGQSGGNWYYKLVIDYTCRG